ncbi:MAG: SET domain-containing protein-lysine N-methyltransferase [bacterium]|nr:SET domain-containing protein-lysine N-methyltransferase [bacterium]
MDILPPQKIKVIDIKGKGRGVVATQDIQAGETIEVCPIVFLSKKEIDFLENESDVLRFYYLIQPETEKCCVMFGYGSIYNHSLSPNAEIDYNEKIAENFLFFKTIKDIKAGEEIVFNYQFDNGIVDFLKQK